MKKIIFFAAIFQFTICNLQIQAQNIGINATGAAPAASAGLDVDFTNKGLLIPRVALTATNAVGPIAAPATSLFVYNTATAGVSPNNVLPGYYYWDGAKWVALSGSGGKDWSLLGNAGTIAPTSAIGAAVSDNFIGTTDAVDFAIATNGYERFRIKSDNSTQLRIGVGTSFTVNLNAGSTPTLFHLHDWGTTANDFAQLNISSATVASGNRTGVINFAATAATNERRAASIESYLTAASGTNVTGDLRFFTNNNNSFTEKMRIEAGGNVGIGITVPTTLLEVSSGAGDAVFGHSTNVGGYLGRETNITIGTPPQTLSGAGVYAANPSSGYTSLFAQSTGAADVAALISYSTVWMAQYNLVNNASAGFNPSASYSELDVTNSTLGGFQIALRGYNNRAALAGNPGYSVGTEGLANSQNQDAFGVTGFAYCNNNEKAGGYFEALTYLGASNAYAYVGTRTGGTNRKITGTASVSEIIPTKDHGRITLTCPESPEYWYQDYGTVELVNGKAHVDLDPILADVIFVNQHYPIRVFCTPVDMLNFNGVAVVNRTETGFDLVELNGGSNSGTIDYQLIVKPKTNYGEGRFPQAPGPIWIKSEEEPAAAKAKNQPNDGREIFNWPPDAVVYGYEELAKKRALEHSTPVKASNTPK